MSDGYDIKSIPWIERVQGVEAIDGETFLRLAEDDCLNSKRVDEFTLRDLKADTENAYVIKMTPAQRAKGSEHGLGHLISVHLSNIDRNGEMKFWTTSQTTEGKKYEQRIQLLDYGASLDLLRNGDATSRQFASLAIFGDIKVYCSCVREGTWVKTADGYKKIEDIEKGDYVLSSDGNFHEVQGLLEQKADIESGQERFLTRSSFIDVPVGTSGDHEFQTFGQGHECVVEGCKEKPSWLSLNKEERLRHCKDRVKRLCGCSSHKVSGRMKNVSPNRLVKMKCDELTEGDLLATSFPFCNSSSVGNISVGINNAIAAGMFFVAGFSFLDSDRICMTVGHKKIERIIEAVFQCFDDATVESCTVAPHEKNKKDIVFRSPSFHKLCDRVFSCHDGQVRLSPEYYLWPESERKGFMAGAEYAGSPNCWGKDFVVSVCNLPTALELHMASLSCGAIGRIHESEKGRFVFEVNKSVFVDLIRSVEWLRIDTENNVLQGGENVHSQLFTKDPIGGGNVFCLPLHDKEKDESGACARYFDISLLDGPHDYIANGIAVSNCPAFLYWGWQYINWQVGSGIEKEDRFPKVRNPELRGAICKHLWQVLTCLPFYNSTLMSSAKKYYPSLFGGKTKKKKEDTELAQTIADILDPEKTELVGVVAISAKLSGEKISGKTMDKSDLSGADLSNTDLSGTSLVGTSLARANLSNADLSGCDLSGADLTGADLSDSTLSGADLSGAKVEGCDFSGSDVTPEQLVSAAGWETATLSSGQRKEAEEVAERKSAEKLVETIESTDDLERLSASNADLSGLNFAKKNFSSALLSGCDLSGNDCRGARFVDADLSKANLSDANLVGARFDGANLTDADLSDANVSGTSFAGANLNGADFSGTSISASQLASASSFEFVVGVPMRIRYEADALSKAEKHSGKEIPEDLADKNLHGKDFIGADLSGKSLVGSDLSSAKLRHSSLRGADLSGCSLRNADLTGADLEGAILDGADATFCILRNANITAEQLASMENFEKSSFVPAKTMKAAKEIGGVKKTSLSSIGNVRKDILSASKNDMHGIVASDLDVSGANLVGREFYESDLQRCVWDGSKGRAVNFSGSILDNCSFKGCDLRGADFSDASLRNVDFSGSDLSGADFEDADIRFAKLYDTGITADQLSKAEYFRTVKNVPKSIMDEAELLDLQK